MINKNTFKKTKLSLIKINIVVVVSFLFVFSVFVYSYFKQTTYTSIDNDLTEELENISNQLSKSSMFYPIILKDPRNMVYVYEGSRIRYYTQNAYFEGVIPKNDKSVENGFYTYIENGRNFRRLILDAGKYEIQIIRNIDSEMNSFKQLISVLLIVIIISIIITYLIALYLTKKALIPIETAWNNQFKFIQNASHELRTPISIVSSKLEVMLKSPNNTISDEVENIADAMKEIRRMKKMVGDLLCLTKEDSIEYINKESINIEELLKEISNNYEEIANVQNKEFKLNTLLNNSILYTDKEKLRQLILILLDNAFKYTRRYDSIHIHAYERGDEIIISIRDSGIGIKNEEIPFIFDRFFRSENVRSENIDGSGIGLSIAKVICLNLDINIRVESILNEYTNFKLYISIR